MANAFFVRCDCRNRRFTGGKSRFLQEADGGKGIANAADELCGIALDEHVPRRKQMVQVNLKIVLFSQRPNAQRDGVAHRREQHNRRTRRRIQIIRANQPRHAAHKRNHHAVHRVLTA